MRLAAATMAVLAFASSAAAQQAAQPAPEFPTVSVIGTGMIRKAPDQASVSLAVENMAPNARTAAQQNAQHMDAVIKAIKGAGIPAERIHTSGYNLMPEYQYTQATPTHPGEQKLVGYRASNTVQVQVDSIPRVGAVIDVAIAAGANRAMGVNFELRDPDAARREALRMAVANARRDAEALAAAAGQALGPLVQLSSAGSTAPPPMPMMMAAKRMQAEDVTTPVEPGEMEISANVVALYRLGTGPLPR